VGEGRSSEKESLAVLSEKDAQTMVRRCLLFLAVASLAVPGGAAWAFSAFVDLSATDGYEQATPTGVAAGGVAVLQGELSTTYPTLFYHTLLYPGASNGTMTDITPSTVLRIGSTNMNASGQFIMCQTSPANSNNDNAPYQVSGGWFYSNGTATSLPQFPGSSTAADTYGVAINNNGDVAGAWEPTPSTDVVQPYIRTGGTDYALNDTQQYGSTITALNTSGQAVAWAAASGINPIEPNAVAWTYTISGGSVTSQTELNLQTKGGLATAWSNAFGSTAYPTIFSSVAVAINNGGQAVISADGDGTVNPLDDTATGAAGLDAAFIYNVNTQAYTLLGGLQIYDAQFYGNTHFGGHAQAINSSGQVVGQMLTSSGGYDAAIWQNGTLTDLNSIYGPSGLNILPAGFTLNNATAIDNQGDIAGYGTDAANNTNQAFVIYAPIPGDANLDGKVDINDLTIVLSNYNQTGKGWTQGEFTGDGKVDINDLTIVLAHYNDTTAPAAGGPAAVPEPCALALLAAGLAGLLAYAWRKRR
jgi:probable HAF family extracellular repeat protein